jgi:predicted O-methyltransferase YrrM
MNVTNDKVTDYIKQLYRPQNEFLGELRKKAEENHIPIILTDTEALILSLIRTKKPLRILEIGTAIGYSAICFATTSKDAVITTIEAKERMYDQAVENIEQAGYSDRIRVILDDGLEGLQKLSQSMKSREENGFDMVFIDAAKGHYKEFWDGAIGLCKDEAVIISDNILLEGKTVSDEYITARRQKTSVRRMRDYLKYITDIEYADSAILPVGDGVAVSVLRKQKRGQE